jgi:dTDP-4-amino-4,6-dideoxygalactose transaminase
MPIHYAGCPARDINEIAKLADEHDLLLFEDAAQSLGASVGSKKVGRFGDRSMFSFCQDKIISTGGEGGILVLNDKSIYQRLKLIRSHGRADDVSYFTTAAAGQYVSHGYNWRLTSMQAAIGLAQMSKMNDNIEKRKRNIEIYIERLKNIFDIEFFIAPNGLKHVYQKCTIRVKNNKRNKLREHLSKNQIGCKSYFDVPVHKTIYYNDHSEDNLPITNKISNEVLSIPMFPSLSEEDIIFITDRIKEL